MRSPCSPSSASPFSICGVLQCQWHPEASQTVRCSWVLRGSRRSHVGTPFGNQAASLFERGPWLCAPASRRVCLYRGTGAPALVRTIVTIVLDSKRPAYRSHSHFSQRKQARLYARSLFLASNFLEPRKLEVQLRRNRKRRTSENSPSESVRKGCYRRSERGFGRYTEAKMVRNELFR